MHFSGCNGVCVGSLVDWSHSVKPKMRLIAEHNFASISCANRLLIFKVNLDNFVALFKRESIHDDLSEYTETNKKKNVS